ncbi:MAG TPA: hypothetical protein VN193_02080 [Candidatus Angelobacter sp.]|nr:hypothetical protein [Candidatus Angelobacter sp.]
MSAAPPFPPPPAAGSSFPPTHQMYLDAAKTLTPDKSLQNIGTSAKQLIAGVATVSTVLGGLGLIKADGLRGPWWAYAVPIVLTVASVVLAFLATGIHRTSVNFDVVEDIESFFDREIRLRAIFVQVGTVCFLAALVWAGLVSAWWGAKPSPVSPLVHTTWSGSGAAAKLNVTAQVSDAKPGGIATMTVTGTRNGGTVTLLTTQATVDSTGSASFNDDISDVAGVSSAQVRVDAGSAVTTTRSLPSPSASPTP